MKSPDETRIVMVGSSNVDLIAYVPRLPAAGETLHGSRFATGCGGKGANQAVMAARLGATVHPVTVLGDDVFGPTTRQNYVDQGCDPTHIHVAEDTASGVAPINVDTETGENSIVIVNGANDLLDPAKVQQAKADIEAADAVICQLETPIPATVEAFTIARAAGVRTILNPAPAPPTGELPAELLAVTDVLIPNEPEAAMLTGLPVGTDDEVVAAGRALQGRGPTLIVLTLGGRGSLVLDGDADPQLVAADRVEPVDTVGAGDCFVGSFAVLLAGHPPAEAARLAGKLATRSVLRQGTQTSFPTREECRAVLAG